MILDDKIPPNLDFFPEIKKIQAFSRTKFTPGEQGVLVVVDVPSPSRLGKIGEYLDSFDLVINIDHHVSNTHYGDIAWVEENVSSTGEMIYELFKITGVEIDYHAALYLYSAILTDSGGFRYVGTTSRTHRIVADLLDKGVNPYWVYSQIYERNAIRRLHLLGDCLKNVKKRGRIVWVEITGRMLKRNKARSSDLEGVIDFLRTVPDTDVAIVFQELNAEVKVTFRSRNPDIDVNKIAKLFEGGGHKMASGCKIAGNLNQVKRKVFKVIKEFMRKR